MTVSTTFKIGLVIGILFFIFGVSSWANPMMSVMWFMLSMMVMTITGTKEQIKSKKITTSSTSRELNTYYTAEGKPSTSKKYDKSPIH